MEERKLELKKLYNETAHLYDRRYAEIQRLKYEKVLKHLPKRVGRVLDLGCGTGLLLRELRRRGRMVVGVDASEEMLGIAKARGERAELVLADADSLPFGNGVFDCFVSVTLLQNMPDPARTVRELARVLKKGGVGIMTSLKHKHQAEELRSWAERAGLEVEESGGIEGSEDIFCIARRR
jgi:ubiquinone/menaquinone biosynthesis C-methylase UbiE